MKNAIVRRMPLTTYAGEFFWSVTASCHLRRHGGGCDNPPAAAIKAAMEGRPTSG